MKHALLALFGLVLLVAAAVWLRTLRVSEITFSGQVHATEAGLNAALRVPADTTLMDLEPDVLADRVRQHPWVAEASVWRVPPGQLKVRVRERRPAALVIDRRGDAIGYLDATGHGMPIDTLAVYDVPLVHGLRDVPLGTPVDSPALRRLLAALVQLDVHTDALVSDVMLAKDGSVSIRTTPTLDHPSYSVRLGRE
ncbi:MAG: FtsQ-type POTRA domain-containing protein, partial [Bacteroidota bacterium]